MAAGLVALGVLLFLVLPRAPVRPSGSRAAGVGAAGKAGKAGKAGAIPRYGSAPFAAASGRLLARGPSSVAVLWWHRRGAAVEGRLRTATAVGNGSAASVRTSAATVRGRVDGSSVSLGIGAGATRPATAVGGSLTLGVPVPAGTTTMVFAPAPPGAFRVAVASLRAAVAAERAVAPAAPSDISP